MSTFLDTNCLLRYLLADNEAQFEIVREQVERGACTSPEFIAECVYVLAGTVYGFSRRDVAVTMEALLDDVACEHEATMRCALALFQEHKLDFADCILAAKHFVEGVPVLTFDKKLQRLIEQG
ncbi:PIN domain-containing protein [uncultured Adlercreutzia sp.]|uniref:PIN domain-containing protein n=1 Tax=uncultured Adlercreutzia sp. TaxID=875803 RepID=UPI0025D023D3|nr:PIN domain-containing protein [uncultured Adlercreutzia sp.]